MSEDKILFSPLYGGKETEFKIFFKLSDGPQTEHAPFKEIVFENGMRCFDAILECGEGFVSKNILFFLQNESTKDFHAQLNSMIASNLLPKDLSMSFGSTFPMTLYPNIYCSRQQEFMTLSSYHVGKDKIDLINYIKDSQDYFCNTCEFEQECLNSSEAEKNITFVNKSNTQVFALDYLPLNILEYSQMISCVNESDKTLLGNELFENPVVKQHILESIYINEDSALNVSFLVIHKLGIISDILEMITNNLNRGYLIQQALQYDNLYLDINHLSDLKLGILPTHNNRSLDRSTKLGLVSDGQVRVIENGGTVFLELKQKLTATEMPIIGESLILYLDNSNICKTIECIVSGIENEFIELSLNCSDKLIDYVVSFFSHDTFFPIKYSPLEDKLTFSDNLFLLLSGVLFKNSVLGIEELTHIKEIIFSSIDKPIETLSISDLIDLINSKSALAVVLRQENIFFKPSIAITSKISNYYWMSILLWLLKLTHKVRLVDLGNSELHKILKQHNNELKQLKSELETSLVKNPDESDEQDIIKTALESMIEDKSWLEEVLSLKDLNAIKKRNVSNLDETYSDQHFVTERPSASTSTNEEDTLIYDKSSYARRYRV